MVTEYRTGARPVGYQGVGRVASRLEVVGCTPYGVLRTGLPYELKSCIRYEYGIVQYFAHAKRLVTDL
jgi:hypothetical protein